MQIRRASRDEAEVLSALAIESKAHWGYAASVMASWQENLRVSSAEIDSKPTWVAEVDGDVVAFYTMVPSRDCWHLDNFWVSPRHMRRGIGRKLLEHALQLAVEGGALNVTVDSDPNAEVFYLACGATRCDAVPAPISGQPDRVRPQLDFSIIAIRRVAPEKSA
jgi:GNAT superfamily N-acetyltransferase